MLNRTIISQGKWFEQYCWTASKQREDAVAQIQYNSNYNLTEEEIEERLAEHVFEDYCNDGLEFDDYAKSHMLKQ